MSPSLDSSMANLSLDTHNVDPAVFEARLADEENGLIENPQPRKRARQNAEDLLTELENNFLEPSDEFSTRWLNALQKLVFCFHWRGSF
jgi:antiviral helicase SKI2